MKKLLVFIICILFISCVPSAEEKAAEEQRMKDSLVVNNITRVPTITKVTIETLYNSFGWGSISKIKIDNTEYILVNTGNGVGLIKHKQFEE